ncbi:MAG TPA: EF-hand domain-containing protein [Phytomonospora sp.]
MAITPLQESKLRKRFAMLDVDGNGHIERADYEELSRRLTAGAGVEPASTEALALTDSLLNIFDALARKMDGDGDGRVSLDEWTRSVTASLIEKDGFDRVIGPAARAVVSVYDTDGSGELDVEELRVFITATGATAVDADEAVRRLDADGSGSISVEEFTRALREFYTSADPEAPGNWIYGRPA